jgi:hypothetical protein
MLIIGIVVLGLLALIVSGPPTPSPPPSVGLSDKEIARELQFCHDKGMTAAHSTFNGRFDKMWCLMEVPK